MSLGGLVAKFSAALLLTAAGVYFLTSPAAHGAPPPAAPATPDYKVEWVATKYITLDFYRAFYPFSPDRNNRGIVASDPLNFGARTKLAIGPGEWNVIYSSKIDGCNQNIPTCYKEVYDETWSTGPIRSDNCYKAIDNCKPGGKYAGDWIWSIGGEFVDSADSPFYPNRLRNIITIGTTSTTDNNIYKSNSEVYDNLFGPENGFFGGCGGVHEWCAARGRGPGFLELFQCYPPGHLTGYTNWGQPVELGCTHSGWEGTYFYTSAAYSWQYSYAAYYGGTTEVPGSNEAGTFMPARWYVKGKIL